MKSVALFLCLVTVALATKDVRLVNRDGVQSTTEGRVEVRLDGQWGQVCSNGFSSQDASVVCRSINGVANGNVVSGQHGIGSDPISITQVQCTGTEDSILDCPYTRQNTCRTGTIAAVNCDPRLGVTGSIGLEAGIIAGVCVCLVAVLGILALLGACLWKNDLCCAALQQA